MQGLSRLSLMLSLGLAIGLSAHSLSGVLAQPVEATAEATPLAKASAPATAASASASSQTPAKPAPSCCPVGAACGNREGATCGVEACANSQAFCNSLICSKGRWTPLEMPPPQR